jgi:hypothetical protein
MDPTTNGGVREVAPMNKLKISNVSDEFQVDHNQNVQKLPNGINLVTIMLSGHGQSIQVTLPFTGKAIFLSFNSVI